SARADGGAHGAGRARHRDRARVLAQPYALRLRGLGSPQPLARPLHPRPRLAGSGARRAALQRRVVAPCAADARARPRRPGGLARAGRGRDEVEVSAAVFVVSTEEETEEVRRRIAFYGSTPSYCGVLEAHGWGELGSELHRLSRSGGWAAMPGLVDDQVLGTV